MEIKFFVRIRGALTPPPRIETPVVQIPLRSCQSAFPRAEAKDVPSGAYDGEADAQRDSQAGPCVWRDGFEELSDLEGVRFCATTSYKYGRIR
jgi:hypothetical protein